MDKDPEMEKLITETNLKYYTKEEIRIAFEEYCPSKINIDTYSSFCRALSCLPKDIVDRIKKEIMFQFLGFEGASLDEETARGCCIELEHWMHEGKKAIIVLTPWLFENEISRLILHEIAHYIQGTCTCIGPNDPKMSEEEADRQARKWQMEREG